MSITIKSLLSSPFFAPLMPILQQFSAYEQLPSLAELNKMLSIADIIFVPQSPKSDDFSEGYEPRIYLQGQVQTREQSWHDFFNALVWQQFTQSKKIINQLQYSFQKQRHPEKTRLPGENMLTLFDENGAIVIAKDPELLVLIKQHRWHELFWERREQVQRDLQVVLFGHGLYEKALHPYIGLTAQALLFSADEITAIDDTVARFLSDSGAALTPRYLTPLPLLGIPGWWPENVDECFYDNKNYFRDKNHVYLP